MSTRKKSSRYYYYRRNETRLHLSLVGLVVASVVLLFLCTSFTWVSGIGTAFLLGALILMIVLIVGSDVWFPRVPDDVWREASTDATFKVHVDEMDKHFARSAKAGGLTERDTGMSILVEEAVELYRERYTVQLLRRGGRRLLILACIVLTFAGMARVLVLVDHGSYGWHLTVNSSLIDYVYFSFIAVSTIGYGDIVPVAIGARVVSIAFGAVTIVYLLMIINYIWIHEARRERLLVEYLDQRYLATVTVGSS
jgi:Ion channel